MTTHIGYLPSQDIQVRSMNFYEQKAKLMNWKIGGGLYMYLCVHVCTCVTLYTFAMFMLYHRYVVLVMDEMKVREDLVYDKTGETLHGFVNLGNVNNQLRELEMQANAGRPHESTATQMLTIMVRGVFIKLEFPYASFPTQGIHVYAHAQVCTLYGSMH